MEKDVKIHPARVNNKFFLQFDFPDYLDKDMANTAIEIWKLEMKRLSKEGKVSLIFNCDCMSGFDTEARRNWQSAMKEQKDAIAEVWVVCNNVFILGAAKTMGVLSGYSIKVTRSISEIR